MIRFPRFVEFSHPRLLEGPVVRSAMLGTTLACTGCDSSGGTAVVGGLVGLVGVAVGSLLTTRRRVREDVHYRETPEAIAAAARTDLLRSVALRKAVAALSDQEVRDLYLEDLVGEEVRVIERRAVPVSVVGRDKEIAQIFDSLMRRGETGLAITGAPNSGTSTLLQKVIHETAKARLRMPSLCPPAWAGGEFYALRVEQIVGDNPQVTMALLRRIFDISKNDPQRIRFVVDHRRHLTRPQGALIIDAILDAFPRKKIGVVLAMPDTHFDDLVGKDSDLLANIRRIKITPLQAGFETAEVPLRAFLAQLEWLRGHDQRFAQLQLQITAHADRTPIWERALEGQEGTQVTLQRVDPTESSDDFLSAFFDHRRERRREFDLQASVVVARSLAIAIYRRFLTGEGGPGPWLLNAKLTADLIRQLPGPA